MDRKKQRNFLATLWLVGAWSQFALLIGAATYLSLMPDPGDAFESVSDKFLHVLCWFVLLCSLNFAVRKPILPWYLAVLLLLYSGVIEVLQGTMPPRQMSLADLLANGFGIGLALVLLYYCAPLYRRWVLAPLRHVCGIDRNKDYE